MHFFSPREKSKDRKQLASNSWLGEKDSEDKSTRKRKGGVGELAPSLTVQ